MTSESDSTSRRRPPTIELTAAEVETDKSSGAGDGSGKTNGGWSGGRMKAYGIGAMIGLVGAGAILAGLMIAGDLPSRQAAPTSSAAMSSGAEADQISAQLRKIEDAIDARQAQQPQAQPVSPELAGRLAAAEAQLKSFGDSLAALKSRFDEVAAVAQGALGKANAASDNADAAKNIAQGSIQRGDLDALAKRVAALESALASLPQNEGQSESAGADRAARLTIAAQGLRAAVERGLPYRDELAAAKALGADQGDIATLEPFAADGVPSAASLGRDLAALVPALRQASGAAPAEGTLIGRLEANAQKLVRVTPVDAPAGNAPAAVVARLDADAARDDTAAAQNDIAALPESARATAAVWIEKAQARDAAIAASRRIAAEALANLAKPEPQ
jgi:hypothetical protein